MRGHLGFPVRRQKFSGIYIGSGSSATGYTWTDATGFGTQMTSPATQPTGTIAAASATNTDNNVGFAHTTNPFVSIYPRSGSTYGTKYTNPATLPASSGRSIHWNYNDSYVAVGHVTTPFMSVYPWADGTGFGTKLGDPAVAPGGTGFGVQFNQADTYLFVAAYNSAPGVFAYNWSAGSIGSQVSNPSSVGPIASTVSDLKLNNSDTAVMVPSASTPYIAVIAWSNSTGWGTRYTNPGTALTGSPEHGCFDRNDTAVFCAHATSPYFTGYPWSNSTGYGTKYTNPSTLPTNTGYSVSPSPFNTYIVVGQSNTAPRINGYAFDIVTGYGTKVADPSPALAAAVYEVVFTNP